MERKYLGDGLYMEHDGYHVILIASDGIEDTNTVYLEPTVLAAFMAQLKELGIAHQTES